MPELVVRGRTRSASVEQAMNETNYYLPLLRYCTDFDPSRREKHPDSRYLVRVCVLGGCRYGVQGGRSANTCRCGRAAVEDAMGPSAMP